MKLIARGVHLEQGQIGGRVGTDHLGGIGGLGGAEFDLDLFAPCDHVVVREHMPLVVDDEARAGGDAAAFGGAEGIERRGFGRLVGFDEGDPLPVAAVDLVDDVGVAVPPIDDRRRHGYGRRAGAFLSLDPAGGDRQPAEETDDDSADQGRAKRSTQEAAGSCSHAPNCWTPSSAFSKRPRKAV